MGALVGLGRRTDATGRSTDQLVELTRAKRFKLEGGFCPEPKALLEAPGYFALNLPALRILGFLKREHVQHGGRENGRLVAPHAQLRRLGISGRKVKPAFEMLEAFGFVRRTSEGFRHGGKGAPATYALTWLPTWGSDRLRHLPTNDFQHVTEAEVMAFLAARKESERA